MLMSLRAAAGASLLHTHLALRGCRNASSLRPAATPWLQKPFHHVPCCSGGELLQRAAPVPGTSVCLITLVLAKPAGLAKNGVTAAGRAACLACSPSPLIFP